MRYLCLTIPGVATPEERAGILNRKAKKGWRVVSESAIRDPESGDPVHFYTLAKKAKRS